MFTVTVLEILLSKDRSVLSPTKRGTGSERFNFNEKPKNYSDLVDNA